ncbi:hypothetical protein L218DRAFT_1010350 [Marasmius fiardii PR-910]|nr:hypothetical protein L218DRAFT_1010350 [Marasmius fiardii PR-910]
MLSSHILNNIPSALNSSNLAVFFQALPKPPPLHSILITSPHGLDFLTFVNDKLVQEPIFRELRDEETIEHWIDALKVARTHCKLPPLHFKPLLPHLPISWDELEALLHNSSSSSSEVNLQPLLKFYKESWDDDRFKSSKDRLVEILSRHIINTHPLVPSISGLAGNLHCPPSNSILTTSTYGREFLAFIHEGLVDDNLFHYKLFKGQLILGWVNALQRIQVLFQSPFKPIPKRDLFTGEIVGWYKPTDRGASEEGDTGAESPSDGGIFIPELGETGPEGSGPLGRRNDLLPLHNDKSLEGNGEDTGIKLPMSMINNNHDHIISRRTQEAEGSRRRQTMEDQREVWWK